MEIINAIEIQKGWEKHPRAKKWLQDWMQIVQAASWHGIQDVRRQFPSADGVKLKSGNIVTVFNAGGNNYRLLTTVVYRTQKIVIWELLTHAQYDKQKWKQTL